MICLQSCFVDTEVKDNHIFVDEEAIVSVRWCSWWVVQKSEYKFATEIKDAYGNIYKVYDTPYAVVEKIENAKKGISWNNES